MPTAASPGSNTGSRGPDGSRRQRWWRLARWTALSLGLLLVAGAAGFYGYYWSLRDAMDSHDLDESLVEEERPTKINDDVTVLLIGSDGNQGHDGTYGGQDFEGERSDALLLMHISPDRDEVTAINFPRDSLVQLPECEPYGETDGTAGYYGMINASLFHGGPPCVVKTIESLTDIRVDHFAHVGFAGFEDMVDAVGGVEMCLPEPVSDDRAHLDLDEGVQTLDGTEALAFVRARYELGDGGDRGRIDRQQMFLAALADEVGDTNLLTEPSRVITLLDAVSEHTSTDSELELDRILSISSTLADIDLDDINFYTVPTSRAPADPNRVVWNEELAEPLFQAIANDQPIDSPSEADGAEADSSAADGNNSERTGENSEQAGPEPDPTPSYPAQEEPEDDIPANSGTSGEGIEQRDGTADPCAEGLGTGADDSDDGPDLR